jgi:DNA-binding CsgD family transcriptional regulator
MAAGRYQDARRRTFAGHERPTARAAPTGRSQDGAPKRAPEPDETWTDAQLERALSMHFTGRKSDREIAERLGLRERTVSRMIAAGYSARTR